MDQAINKAYFNELVNNPAGISQADFTLVENLLQQFPYCQILQYAAEKVNYTHGKAALYATDRTVLHQFLHAPENLVSAQISLQNEAEILEKIGVSEAAGEDASAVQAELKMRSDQATSPDTLIDDTDQLILQSIASSDFFALEEKANNVSEVDEKPSQEVSRYDDDQMPYTFLWWLNKTRKEHADTYQPYVSFKLDTSQSIKKNVDEQLAGEIHIPDFDLQKLADQQEPKPVTPAKPHIKRKEDDIIERFIQEDPQISTPSADKITKENKARKSSEDSLDLVSETLARIYTEQMLLDKAIETYQKLSLKFPEKSTYFASQISDLENRKIN